MNTSQNGADPRQWLLEELILALSRLARPAEGQVAYLDTLGTDRSADELALQLDDVAEAALARIVHQPPAARAAEAQDTSS